MIHVYTSIFLFLVLIVCTLIFLLSPLRFRGTVFGVSKEEHSAHSFEPSQVLSQSESTSQFRRPENPPKYFGIDIDGTFYTENEEELRRNVEAFAEAKKRGYTPFICTGRTLDGASVVLNALEAETGYKGFPGIYLNGSLVYDENGYVIYSKPFSRAFIKAVCDCITEGASANTFVFYTKYEYYSLEEIFGNFQTFLEYRGMSNPKNATTKGLLTMEVIAMSVCCKRFRIGNFTDTNDYVCKTARSGLCNINPPCVTKAIGIIKLMEHFNAKPEDCGFIGDGDNDVEAMELSNMSFAVGNAPDSVKKHAKWVMEKTCDDGVVAEALALVYGFNLAIKE